MLLRKIAFKKEELTAIKEIVEIYRGKIVDLSKTSMIVELTGETSKIDGFMKMADGYDIVKVCRTGITAMERGWEEKETVQ